jgi:hypothetical protein
MAMDNTQLVTVPVMDVRFEALNSALERRFAAIDMRFAAIDVRFAQIDGRFAAIDARFVELEARMMAFEAKMEAKFERLTVRLVIAMLLSQTALGPVGMAALEAAHRALSTFLH